MKSLQGGPKGHPGRVLGALGAVLGHPGRLLDALGDLFGLQMACARQMEGLGRVQGHRKNGKSMFLFDPELTRYAHRCFSVYSFFLSFFGFCSFAFFLFLVYSICFHRSCPSDDLGGAWGMRARN